MLCVLYSGVCGLLCCFGFICVRFCVGGLVLFVSRFDCCLLRLCLQYVWWVLISALDVVDLRGCCDLLGISFAVGLLIFCGCSLAADWLG